MPRNGLKLTRGQRPFDLAFYDKGALYESNGHPVSIKIWMEFEEL